MSALQDEVSVIREKLGLAVEELGQAMGLTREGDETLETNPLGAGMCFGDAGDLLATLAESIAEIALRLLALGKGEVLAPVGGEEGR